MSIRLERGKKHQVKILSVRPLKQIDLKKPPYGVAWIHEVRLEKSDGVQVVCEARTPKREQNFFIPNTIACVYVEFAGNHTDEIAICEPDAPQEYGQQPVPNSAMPVGVIPNLGKDADLAMWFAKDILVARIVRGLCDGTPMDLTQMFSDADTIRERLQQMKEELPFV